MAAPNFIIENSPNPSAYAEAVTPSDTVSLTKTARALYVGGAGNITALMPDGSVVLFSNVQGGSILPVLVNRVNATATTATSIVALY